MTSSSRGCSEGEWDAPHELNQEQLLVEDLQELRKRLCEVSRECGCSMTYLLQKFLVLKRDEVAMALGSWPSDDGQQSLLAIPTEHDPFGDSDSGGSSSSEDAELGEHDGNDSEHPSSGSSPSNESFDAFMANMATAPSSRGGKPPPPNPGGGEPQGWFWEQCSVL